MKRLYNRIPQWIAGLFGSVVIIGLVTLLLKSVESELQIQLIALLYLLPILGCTVLWGLTTGILAGLLSFLAFNYFFIQPYYTLSVHKTQDLITLIVFLIVAVVVSQLVGQARQGVKLAKMREWEATRMYELISALAGLTNVQDIIQTLAHKIIDTFHFNQVEISATNRQEGQASTYRIPVDSKLPEPCELSMSMFTARNTEG